MTNVIQSDPRAIYEDLPSLLSPRYALQEYGTGVREPKKTLSIIETTYRITLDKKNV